MTPPDVSDAAVEAALSAVPFADEGDSAMVWQQLGYSNERAEKIMRAAIAAAVPHLPTSDGGEKRALLASIQESLTNIVVPKMTESRAEYFKAGARAAIAAVNAAIKDHQ